MKKLLILTAVLLSISAPNFAATCPNASSCSDNYHGENHHKVAHHSENSNGKYDSNNYSERSNNQIEAEKQMRPKRPIRAICPIKTQENTFSYPDFKPDYVQNEPSHEEMARYQAELQEYLNQADKDVEAIRAAKAAAIEEYNKKVIEYNKRSIERMHQYW